VAILGVKAVLVLGHTSCGAVTAAIRSDAVPGQISMLFGPLQRAVEEAHGDLSKAIEANARIQADVLRTSSTIIRDAVAAGKLKVVSGVYDLGTGTVSLT
jgi:carbonic anhydrase